MKQQRRDTTPLQKGGFRLQQRHLNWSAQAGLTTQIPLTQRQRTVETTPGGSTPISTSQDAVFYGSVSGDTLLRGSVLAEQLGVVRGLSFDPNPDWLKLAFRGRILYLAQRPLRSDISWEYLYAIGVVSGSGDVGYAPQVDPVEQTATITLGGILFRVRLPYGADPGNNPVPFSHRERYDDPEGTRRSEWTQCVQAALNTNQYTENDLAFTNRAQTWCIESNTDGYRVLRGVNNRTDLYMRNDGDSYRGWRPVLEVVR